MGWTRWNGNQIISALKNAAGTAVEKTCNLVLQESKQEVPLDEGILLRSGVVIMKYELLKGTICYGGGSGTGHPRIPYALRWHEEQANFQHGRKNKYLKDPFNRLAEKKLKEFLKQETRGIFS